MNTLNAATIDFPDENTVHHKPVAAPAPVQAENASANREIYYQRVCQFLIRMKGSQWIELNTMLGSAVVPVPEKLPHFIEAVKRFIDEGRDWYHFGNVYFNDPYTRIYKCEVDIYLRAKKGDS